MPGAKEIRTKIKSVKSTQKITRAMEKVALSKMMRAQERLKATRPYVRKIREVIGHLAAASSDTVHPFMVERPVKRVALIIVSSDRGLAGGLNSNLFRAVVRNLREYSDQGVEVDYAVVGAKALGFFKRYGGRVVADAQKMGDAPKMETLLGLLSVVIDGYRAGTYDRVVLASNGFVNTMTQKPTLATLLPVEAIKVENTQQHWDYLYEPSADALLDQMLTRYVEAQVYGAVVENGASEQSARMVAMKAATDSAGKIIGSLQTAYNKARQASITKEISEIVGGAAAV